MVVMDSGLDAIASPRNDGGYGFAGWMKAQGETSESFVTSMAMR
jgi:hypothetical protein